MKPLLQEIKNCKVCLPHLENGVNPVVTADITSKIALIGQAPGSVVHKTGIPWDDKSGENLRRWLNIDANTFYNAENFALIPMGFCYPGKGKSGDLPPRKECQPLWHPRLFNKMTNIQLTILIAGYAQQHYLGTNCKATLTETVKNFESYLPEFFPLPHPSPRNNIWQKKNPWFQEQVIPELQLRIKNLLE